MRTQRSRNLLLAGIVCIGLALLIAVYYTLKSPVESAFGERYVNSEIPLIFPFYEITSFKPITLIVYLLFTGALFMLEAGRDRLAKIDLLPASIFFAFLTFAAGYEVVWNFYAWFSTWERVGGSVDAIVNTAHSYSQQPVNFNFATKLSFLVFALALYTCVYLARLRKDLRE